jgi:hypothetical protein
MLLHKQQSAGRPLPLGRFMALISVRGSVDPRAIVRLEGLGQLRNPVTSSGMKPATFRSIAERLNQLRYHVPLTVTIHNKILSCLNSCPWYVL